jgi:hypothetical protein
MELVQFTLHYGMHFILPFIIAFLFFRKIFWKASILLLLANLIDLDHLLANPIFDPNRCSIGFHALHSYIAIAIYFILLFFPKSRIIAIGLLLHILADQINCMFL